MPTVAEMKRQMINEVDAAAKRADIMVGSVSSWPQSAMAAFLDACLRLRRKRVCEWSLIEEGSNVYNTCREGEEFHLMEGMDLWPRCHWCGGLIKVVELSESESAQ